MDKNILFEIANSAVDGLKCDITGICSISAEIIVPKILSTGFRDFEVVNGFIELKESKNKIGHTWIELYDGTKIDPSINGFISESATYHSVTQRYTPTQFMNLINKEYDKLNLFESNEFKNILCILKEENDMPLDAPSDKKPGSNIFGDESPESSDNDTGDNDEKNNIFYYSKKLKDSKIIKFQNSNPEPSFEFDLKNKEYYNKYYIGKSKVGSIILPICQINNKQFIYKVILPKLDSVILNALNQKKRTVVLGFHGVPFAENKYSNNAQGLIAKELNKKYKNKYIIYDSWSPNEYYTFISNSKIWDEVKNRTEARNIEIKSALFLYLLTTIDGIKFSNKLKTENVLSTCEKWGINRDIINNITKDSISKIFSIVYPEFYQTEETLASFIIKTYLQLLRVDLIKKILDYEKKGNIVIVFSNLNTAWVLKPVLDNLDKFNVKTKSNKKDKEKPEKPSNDNKKLKDTEKKPEKSANAGNGASDNKDSNKDVNK